MPPTNKKFISGNNDNFARTILVASDEESVRVLLHEIMEAAGYQVISAAADREAIGAASARRVDLLVTDLASPGWRHVELFGAFQRRFPNTKIIAFSGMLAAGLLRLALSGGEDGDIAKRMIDARLLAAVRASLINDRLQRPNREVMALERAA
jgi:DNA-binding NtrC family response regulator